jgi:hypothetical protein
MISTRPKERYLVIRFIVALVTLLKIVSEIPIRTGKET